jgi:hypothetical protein
MIQIKRGNSNWHVVNMRGKSDMSIAKWLDMANIIIANINSVF